MQAPISPEHTAISLGRKLFLPLLPTAANRFDALGKNLSPFLDMSVARGKKEKVRMRNRGVQMTSTNSEGICLSSEGGLDHSICVPSIIVVVVVVVVV